MDVVDENEALQQFFAGQDVHGALENAMMDTHMLEEFIDCDLELSGKLQNKLLDSPPDSGSELYSPPQSKGLANKCPGYFLEAASRMNLNGQVCPAYQDCTLKTGNAITSWANSTSANSLGSHGASLRAPFNPSLSLTSKKRKHSEMVEDSLEFLTWSGDVGQMPIKDFSSDMQDYDCDKQNVGPVEKCCQSLTWQPYQRSSWSSLFNHSYEKLPDVGYHIVTNKGFNFSSVDDAFVCQKKNHFQITVYIRVVGNPEFVKTHLGLKPVDMFHLKAFGIKVDAPNQVIIIEQSQSDRSKKTLSPVKLRLPGDQVTKVTMARLHFSETTANNMRKKGKPNPEQRIGGQRKVKEAGKVMCIMENCGSKALEKMYTKIYAFDLNLSDFPFSGNIEEREIKYGASNPGQFENDSDTFWQRGQVPEMVICHGQVGINTDAPDEALVVCGNMKVMGAVMHPSDSRAKQNIQEVDTQEQLRRIAQMRLVEYDYKPEFASAVGINQIHQTGVIAQEVQEFLPRAVRSVGNVICENGEKVDDFLMVDKDQIFMENVGAVKQLCKLTNNLEVRIEELERWNKTLARLKQTNSFKSSTTAEKNPMRKFSEAGSCLPSRKSIPTKPSKVCFPAKKKSWSSYRIFQITVIALVAVMALCVMTICTLYVLSIPEQDIVHSGPSISTSRTTISPSTTLPVTITRYNTVPSSPRPTNIIPEVNFCDILPCHRTHCCPKHQAERNELSYLKMNAKEERKELSEQNWIEKPDHGNDWTDTTISSIQILETQQKIDHHYCRRNLQCGSGNYSYIVPLNKHTPLKVKISLEINTTEPLIVFQCKITFGKPCLYYPPPHHKSGSFQETTQGFQHLWVLPVASLYESAYHFRVAVPDFADCSTDPNYAGIFFTDYYFYFYRNCF
ncbi:LOW QUALITY PROTEIN: myelin regulatory factor-like protein [Sceloporus undulatus]|uniref:LOW QUALITY PROTEIN: myelin regulatory factor-like protein n=1 Tax=Sceloporus undulatus TaxID=8520 RepID=UPI001C4D4ED8|nr:LOW QUALITY PROTEIN: myelin regulatory factor-like protein [Sceloporus undulatus]